MLNLTVALPSAAAAADHSYNVRRKKTFVRMWIVFDGEGGGRQTKINLLHQVKINSPRP